MLTGIRNERPAHVRLDERVAVDDEAPGFGDTSEAFEGFYRETAEYVFEQVIWQINDMQHYSTIDESMMNDLFQSDFSNIIYHPYLLHATL